MFTFINKYIQTNQRERAEVRCGAAIKEMESMKADMLTLVQQLRDAEEKCNELTKSNLKGVGTRNDNELEKRLKSREEKLQKYRELILRLKNEFIKSEEDHAVKLAAMKESKSNLYNNSGINFTNEYIENYFFTYLFIHIHSFFIILF